MLVQNFWGCCPHKAELSSQPPVISFLFFIVSTRAKKDELFDKECSALLKVFARKASSSDEWTEASEESNQEQILWAWSQVVRWSKNLYSASWKPIHSGEVVPDRWGKRKEGKTDVRHNWKVLKQGLGRSVQYAERSSKLRRWDWPSEMSGSCSTLPGSPHTQDEKRFHDIQNVRDQKRNDKKGRDSNQRVTL